MGIPPPPPGFQIIGDDDDDDPVDRLLAEGFVPTNGYRTRQDIERIRAQGYSPAENSLHLDGDAIDWKHPKLPMDIAERRIAEVMGPDWRILNEGHHIHTQRPGYGRAPGTPGTDRFGLAPLPEGFELEQRGSLAGGNWNPAGVPAQSGMPTGAAATAEQMADAASLFGERGGGVDLSQPREFRNPGPPRLDDSEFAVRLNALLTAPGLKPEDRIASANEFAASQGRNLEPEDVDRVARNGRGFVFKPLEEQPGLVGTALTNPTPFLSLPIPEKVAQLSAGLGDVLGYGGGDQARMARQARTAAQWLPVVGGASSIEEGGMEIERGNYGSGIVQAGLGTIDFIPMVGPGAKFLRRSISGAPETIVRDGVKHEARTFTADALRGRMAVTGAPEVPMAGAAPSIADELPETVLPDIAVTARRVDPAGVPARVVDRIDVANIPPPPPGFTLIDEPSLGHVRPMGEQATPEDIANMARSVRPDSVLPIPENRVETLDEFNRIGDPRPLLEAPNERDALLPRKIASRDDLFRTSNRRGPLDLSQRIRQLGGLRDDGGDLAAMGVSNEARRLEFGNDRGLGRLVDNERGVPLDEMARKLHEEGWFPNSPERVTPDDLKGLLHKELVAGERVFHPNDWEEVERFHGLQAERGRIETAANEGSPLVDDIGQPVGLDDLRSVDADMPATAYEDLPKLGGRVANINVGKLETRGDIRRALQTVETRFGGFDAARRGKITQAETAALASELRMTPDDLLRRRKGQALNAEQALAARQILAKSSDELVALAGRVKGGSDEDVAGFHRALVRHAAIQEQVSGATAEAGRTLAQFKMAARAKAIRGEVLESAIEGAGGRRNLTRTAERILELQRDPGKLNTFTKAAAKPGVSGMALEMFYNFILSGTATHAVNMISNAGTAVAQLPEQALAAGFGAARRGVGKLRGKPDDFDRILLSEMGPRAIGLMQGALEGLPLAWRALRTGRSTDPVTRIELQTREAIPGRLGKVLRTPTRALMAEDEFFKAVNSRVEMNGLAVRKARGEGLRGQALRDRIAALAENPTGEMLQQAREYARYATHTRKTGEVATLLRRVKNIPALRWLNLFVPFVDTPTNLLKYAVERSPAAPLLSGFRDDFRAGGARRDIALARVAFGTGIGLLVSNLAAQGFITGGGPADDNAKRLMEANGWQPYSVKLGDKYVSYNRMDPFALHLGTVADLVLESEHMTEAQRRKATAVLIGSITQQLGDKTYLSGISNLVQAWKDPARHGESLLERLGASITVPAMVGQITRTIDPVGRDPDSIPEAIQARIPGLSDDLPARRDIFGREKKAGYTVSPLQTSDAKHDPVAEELLRLGVRIGPINRNVGGNRLTTRQLSDYQAVAGQYLHQDLADAMNTPDWEDSTDRERRKWADNIKKDARKAAREELGLGRDPEDDDDDDEGGGSVPPPPPGFVPMPPPGFELVQ